MDRTLKTQLAAWMTRKEQQDAYKTKGRTALDRITLAIESAPKGSIMVRARMGKEALCDLNPKYHVAWVVSRLHIMTLPVITFTDEAFRLFQSSQDIDKVRTFSDIVKTDGMVSGTDEDIEKVCTEYLGLCHPHETRTGSVMMVGVPIREPKTITYGLDWEVFDWMEAR